MKIGRVLVLSSRIHDSIVLNIFLASFSNKKKKFQPKLPSQALLRIFLKSVKLKSVVVGQYKNNTQNLQHAKTCGEKGAVVLGIQGTTNAA